MYRTISDTTALTTTTAVHDAITPFKASSFPLGLSDHLGREVSRGGHVDAEGLGAGTGRELV